MRGRALALLLALAALAAAASGCGSNNNARTALDDALGYMPRNSLAVVVIKTNPDDQQIKNASALLDKFPFGATIKDRIRVALASSRGVNFNTEVKPLLGNDAAIGVFPPGGGATGNGYVVAWKTKGGDIGKEIAKSGQKVGSEQGATLYQGSDGTLSAVKGQVLIVAKTRALLDSALSARNSSSRMTEQDFTGALRGLDQGALIRVTGDFQKLLATSAKSAQALKVPWVAALRTFGLTSSIDSDGISEDFLVRTAGVSASQVPLATGAASPPVVKRPGEVAVGVRNPAQVVNFIEQVASVTNPKSLLNKNKVGRLLGVDIDRDVVGQLGGNSAGSFGVDGSLALRADLKDPSAFRATLAKIIKNLPTAQRAEGKPVTKISVGPGGLYSYTKPGVIKNGVVQRPKPRVLGVIGNEVVVAGDAASARAFATAPAAPVPSLTGAVAITVDPKSLVTAILRQRAHGNLPPAAALIVPALTAHLQSLDGSIDSETTGLRGHFKLTIR
jgi:uncharacterized protein DUF3352